MTSARLNLTRIDRSRFKTFDFEDETSQTETLTHSDYRPTNLQEFQRVSRIN